MGLIIWWLLWGAAFACPQAAAAHKERVAWVIFVDDLHLSFRDTGRIRELVEAIVKNLVLDGDPVAIRTSGPSGVETGFEERLKLLPVLKKVFGGGLRPTEILDEQTARHEVRTRTRMSLSRATGAAALLARADTPRRALLYISSGYEPHGNAASDRRELINAAGGNDIRIFAFGGRTVERASTPLSSRPDWAPYQQAASNELRTIAEHGGGFAVVDEALEAAFERIRNLMRPGNQFCRD